jgi:hypothetical protein
MEMWQIGFFWVTGTVRALKEVHTTVAHGGKNSKRMHLRAWNGTTHDPPVLLSTWVRRTHCHLAEAAGCPINPFSS